MIDEVINAKQVIKAFEKLSYDELFKVVENYTGKTVSPQFKKEWKYTGLANRDIIEHMDYIEESLFIDESTIMPSAICGKMK